MSAAFDLLQWRHDMAEPECDTKFIDTTEGQNWLAGAVDDLIEDTLYVSPEGQFEILADFSKDLVLPVK